MARTVTIIGHIATFLAGVFVTNLMSTYHLTANDFDAWSASLDMSSFQQTGSTAVRGTVSKNEDNIANQNKLAENHDAPDNDEIQLKKENQKKGMCSLLPQPTPTALSMWSSHLPLILNSTQHPEDREYTYRDFTAILQHHMTPDRIQRGVKTLPLDWTPVERGLDVMYKRWRFIQDEVNAYRAKNNLPSDASIPPNVLQEIHKKPNIPRPLNILVMGGSVTMGVVCHINPVTKAGIARRSCAWPGRMTSFFSMLFGGYELVQFDAITMGGTNTESGITIWDYSLLPGDTPYPDVVINAYATNDMHYNSVQTALARNTTIERSVIELGQAFVRKLLTPKRECGHQPPLLLYLDDYLGNEQNEVLTTMISSQAVHLLSGYYGLGSISYADAVRDIVYGDNKEWWFHANWFENGVYQRAVHPHMGMHITNVWIVGFYLVNLVTTYCSLPPRLENDGKETQHQQVHTHLHAGQSHQRMPSLYSNTRLKGGPNHKPGGIPPTLTGNLSLENITQLWSDDSKATSSLWKTIDECTKEGKVSSDGIVEKPCMYSWIVGLERFLDKPKTLTGKIQPHLSLNEGWGASDDNNKLGWVPLSGLGSKFVMEWKSVTQPIRALTLMIMRSYGDKWEGSKLKVEVFSKGKMMANAEIVGFHDKKTSETYNIKMRIGKIQDQLESTTDKEIQIGSDLKVSFELVGGTTFKISGIAICDH